MTAKEIAKLIENKHKDKQVMGVFEYGDNYLVSYSKNGSMMLDPFYLVSKDGKIITNFNPASDPIEFSKKIGKKPLYLRFAGQ